MATIKDLEKQYEMGIKCCLYCLNCGAENSADPGDYFYVSSEYVFICCEEPMALVTKRTVYTEVG